MYRVRVGPFDGKDSAESAQDKLQQAGVDAALVRVERSAAAATTR
jgi:cell division protein FtsN